MKGINLKRLPVSVLLSLAGIGENTSLGKSNNDGENKLYALPNRRFNDDKIEKSLFDSRNPEFNFKTYQREIEQIIGKYESMFVGFNENNSFNSNPFNNSMKLNSQLKFLYTAGVVMDNVVKKAKAEKQTHSLNNLKETPDSTFLSTGITNNDNLLNFDGKAESYYSIGNRFPSKETQEVIEKYVGNYSFNKNFDNSQLISHFKHRSLPTDVGLVVSDLEETGHSEKLTFAEQSIVLGAKSVAKKYKGLKWSTLMTYSVTGK